MWYVSVGWLASDSKSSDSDRVMIKVSNESDGLEFLVQLFEDIGFSAGYTDESIQISAHDTKALLDWMGKAPPGFEYKWNITT